MKRIFIFLSLTIFTSIAKSQLPLNYSVVHEFESGSQLIKYKDSLGIISSGKTVVYPLSLESYYLRITSKLWRISKPVKEVYILDNKPVELMRSHYGLLDAKTGAIVFYPEYKSIERISDEKLLVQKDSLTGIFNVSQRIYELPPVYKTVRVLKNENIFVRRNDTLFLLNKIYHPITYYTNLLRFEPQPDNPCLFIFRTPTLEGVADCEGNKIFFENWKEVLDLASPMAYIKTTEGQLLVYDIYKKKQILKQPYSSYNIGRNISVYYNKIWSDYDYNGNKLRDRKE